MGKGTGGDFDDPRLCTFAGPGGEVRSLGDLAFVCSRSVGSRRPDVCGKSPEEFSFCRAHVDEGQAYSAEVALVPELGDPPSAALVVGGFRRRVAAPDSSPSFFSSSGLHPSLVART
jgi:hypothetical protein